MYSVSGRITTGALEKKDTKTPFHTCFGFRQTISSDARSVWSQLDYLAAPIRTVNIKHGWYLQSRMRPLPRTRETKATITNTNHISIAKRNTIQVEPGQPQQQAKCLRDASCKQMVLIAIQIFLLKSHFIVESGTPPRPNLVFMTV